LSTKVTDSLTTEILNGLVLIVNSIISLLMSKVQFLTVQNYDKLQIKECFKRQKKLNLIINNSSYFNSAFNLKYIDFNYVIELFSPFLLKSFLAKKKKIIWITSEYDRHSCYSKMLIYTLLIENNRYYQLTYYVSNDDNNANCYELRIMNGADDSTTIFTEKSNTWAWVDILPIFKVKNDDQNLGFYAPVKVILPESLCQSCRFHIMYSPITCTVNPIVNSVTCFECRDYEAGEDNHYRG
jgi:hypothetical protein